MFDGVREFTATVQGDSAEFMEMVQALVAGIASDYEPVRLYVIRIDNWFGPKWMHFAGKFTAGKGAAIGVHKRILHVPPFVPHRVVVERVCEGPNYDEAITRPPLHIECTSELALTRRIANIDNDAAFVWFSGKSEAQKRGSIMVYLPAASTSTISRRRERRTGAFYIGFSQRITDWHPAMLRGVSLGEVEHLEECGSALIENQLSTANR